VSVIGAISGIVPNGVAAVTVGEPPSQGVPAITSTVRVVNNVFVTRITPVRPVRQLDTTTITWRNAQGRTIKTLRALTPGVETRGWCGGCGG